MISIGNGIVQLEAGERVPFSCPRCQEPVKFQENVDTVTCPVCKYTDDVEEFMNCKYDPVKSN